MEIFKVMGCRRCGDVSSVKRCGFKRETMMLANESSRMASAARPAAYVPVIRAVSGHRLVDVFRMIGPEFSERARVEVVHSAFDDAVHRLQQAIALQNCDVVVASGSNGAYLRGHLSVPVVLLKVGGYDLMAALCQARALSSRIAVVLHHEVAPELRQFTGLFDIPLELRAYDTQDDARRRIQELAGLGVEVVVGAGMVADLAEQAGLASIFLYSIDSARAALDDALAIALAQREERSRRTQLDSVLRHLGDGVVAVDMSGRVTAINPAAGRIAGIAGMAGQAPERALGLLLPDVVAGLEPGQVLALGRAELGRVEDVRGRSLVIDCVPLHDAGLQTGAVFTLHTAEPLEQAVSRLRAHGHRRSRTARYTLDQLVAASAPMRELVRRCEVLARSSDATVLIQGESGSGKEVVAQGIHQASKRSAHPFVAINCGAFPESLLESELFGYEEGAFTGARRRGKAGLFEAADGGTLFLDEVGEMPLLLQTRLLRALQEKEITRVGGIDAIPVDVRIVAASHRDLSGMVDAGAFRQDLFYRLHILLVHVPPLRERPEDMEALAALLVPAALKRAGIEGLAPPLLDAVMPLLRGHAWPGNVRELENVAERMVVECLLAGGVPAREVLGRLLGPGGASPAALPQRGAAASTQATDVARGATLMALRQGDEAQRVRDALAACGGDRDAAARMLGISRTTLWRKSRQAN
jgi:propionate catabolism operon transcriptional regulator